MEWLEPWFSTESLGEAYHSTFLRQLETEVAPEHVMFGLPVCLIGRDQGDDALFEILDGSGRVAVVHLTWSKAREVPPWPGTTLYSNIEEWAQRCMLVEHQEWKE